MTTISTVAFAIAGLWILSLLALPLEFSGSSTFAFLTNALTTLAGVGMLIFILNVDRAVELPGNALRTAALVAGIAGCALFAGGTLLVMVGQFSFERLSPWTMGGLGLVGLWLTWVTLQTPGALDLTQALRWFGFAVGIGFVLFAISVQAIGVIDPTASDPAPIGFMTILQYAGGLLAYIGWPIWLIVIARRLL
jgi:hypothetical protein